MYLVSKIRGKGYGPANDAELVLLRGPQVGMGMWLLRADNGRRVFTTSVTRILSDPTRGVTFVQTSNSLYELTALAKPEPQHKDVPHASARAATSDALTPIPRESSLPG